LLKRSVVRVMGAVGRREPSRHRHAGISVELDGIEQRDLVAGDVLLLKLLDLPDQDGHGIHAHAPIAEERDRTGVDDAAATALSHDALPAASRCRTPPNGSSKTRAYRTNRRADRPARPCRRWCAPSSLR